MSGIVLSSQMSLYYNLRNLFFAFFAVLLAVGIIYGIRVHIILIIQKYFGIEKRREIARMQEGKKHNRKTSARLRLVQQNGKKAASGAVAVKNGIDVSMVTTMELKEKQEAVPLEKLSGTMILENGNMTETMALGSGSVSETIAFGSGGMSETIALGSGGMSETTVLGDEGGQPETAVLNQEPDLGVWKRKNLVIVHGEDIF